MDEANPESNYLQKLVGVFGHHGLSSQLSKTLFDLAKTAKSANRLEDSLELLNQAFLA